VEICHATHLERVSIPTELFHEQTEELLLRLDALYFVEAGEHLRVQLHGGAALGDRHLGHLQLERILGHSLGWRWTRYGRLWTWIVERTVRERLVQKLGPHF